MSHHSNHPPNQGSLVCNANGDPIPHLANCLKVLEEAESCLAYNELKHAATLTGVPPWRPEDEDDIVPAVDDIQVLQALVWVQRHKNGLAANKDTVGQALEVIARRHPFHPVRNMLTGLVWDGHDRLDDWMIQFLDAPDTGFVRRAGRYTLIGAVARVMDPGCRFDTVLVLEGPQGEYKSTVVEILGGDWYLDGLGSEGKMDKEAVIAMAGFWIIELAEIDYHLRQNNASALKAFLSRRTDTYRPLYGRSALQAPRQSIFVGTTNKDLYLVDSTGNRRFLPVPIFTKGTPPNPRSLSYIMPQLWAQAVVQWRAGERYHFEGRDELRDVEEEAAERFIPDTLDEAVDEYCRVGDGWRSPVTTVEAVSYIISTRPWTANWTGMIERSAAILKRFGYHRLPRGRVAGGARTPRQFAHD
jgi:predicted P-loop ATPase